MNNGDTGLLVKGNDIKKLHRKYFAEMTSLLGVKTIFRSPKETSKDYDLYGELDTFYNEPKEVWCIFEEHPKQYTMKLHGWNSELSEGLSIIHVPYGLEGLQAGALFIVPSAIDSAEGRVFKVIRLTTSMVYPDSVACEIGPVFRSAFDREAPIRDATYHVLKKEDDD